MPDVFPVLFTVCQPRCCHKQLTYSYVGEDVRTKITESLNLSDLKDIKPKYLSNIVVNRWKESEESEDNYELLIMSPTEIERLDRDSKEPSRFEGKLEPADVKLSDAMATSAAALSEHMGKYDQSLEGLSRFPAFLGLEMGATLITDLKSVQKESALLKVVHILEN